MPACNETLTTNCSIYCNATLNITTDCVEPPILCREKVKPRLEYEFIETTSVTSYIEYQDTYEWIVANPDEGFFLYTIFECENEVIKMRYPLTDKIMERKDLGILSVIIDIVIMTCFLFAIWIMSYLVRLDSERHKRLLFETKEFSIIVNNLPKITSLYTIEDLKADLYIHFQQIVKD